VRGGGERESTRLRVRLRAGESQCRFELAISLLLSVCSAAVLLSGMRAGLSRRSPHVALCFGFGVRVQLLGLRVKGFVLVSVLGFSFSGFGVRVSGLGFRV
jgi:hypothetical protein